MSLSLSKNNTTYEEKLVMIMFLKISQDLFTIKKFIILKIDGKLFIYLECDYFKLILFYTSAIE